ncbi:polysaccharide biosynthesis protein [Bradyrhizobium sp.]|uniref:polysaccharide biosynthesis protein n=1 Tax=Bradyrhizobium sp. TaxID=376 RepID=UPI003C73AB5D
MVIADVAVIPAALLSALILKSGHWWPPVPQLPLLLAVAALASIPIFVRFGLYRAVVRYFGMHALAAVFAGVTLSVLLLAAVDRLLGMAQLSAPVLAIYWALATIYVGGTRMAMRYLFSRYTGRQAERVVIYGAGEAGAQLCAALMGGRDCYPVAFIDDKRALRRSIIHGIEVFGPDELPRIIRRRDIEGVLLALPSASRRRKREILTLLEPYGLHVRSLPDMGEILAGKARTDEIREVDVADLLGRDPVPPYPQLFDACIRGKAVLVTGAGGSIGSELCRQIIRLGPRVLILYESSELALYEIHMDLRAALEHDGLDVKVIALLGNAHHRDRVLDVMASYGVQTVYHAAAYKHVPIVEQNVIEGVHNNVLSTWNTAEAAIEAQVETFVLISTDKAVNPTNVMGATKRLSEIVLQGLQQRSTRTRFCMVRFGNVLASSGSVVPLFSEQIRRGGPVTVTHPDVVRYFMTIPEAAQLVIQAGSMARGGDVFVLDMGKPVRIDELARRMIGLMGMTVRDEKNPDGDIEIEYSGLRPAEKLFEELLIGNNVSGTDHPMILRAMEHALPWERVEELLREMQLALRAFDTERTIALLGEAVVEYQAASPLHDLVTQEKRSVVAEQSKVTDLQSRRSRQGLN